jgi:predicted RNA binding protein YcfA (HicA-like mRNA interferase family)
MVMLSGFRPADIIRKLRRAGFVFDRQARGSHQVWINLNTRARAIIPVHPGDLPAGTVRSIIRQAGLSVEEFLEL